MRIAQSRDQKIKALVHGIQAGFIFLEGCLVLAIMTKSGGIGRAVGYTFGLVFATLGAITCKTPADYVAISASFPCPP